MVKTFLHIADDGLAEEFINKNNFSSSNPNTQAYAIDENLFSIFKIILSSSIEYKRRSTAKLIKREKNQFLLKHNFYLLMFVVS